MQKIVNHTNMELIFILIINTTFKGRRHNLSSFFLISIIFPFLMFKMPNMGIFIALSKLQRRILSIKQDII